MKAAGGQSAVTLFVPLRWPLCIALCAGAAFSSWLFFHPSLYIWKAVYVASDFLQFYQRKIVNKQRNLEENQTQISFSLPLPGHSPLVPHSPTACGCHFLPWRSSKVAGLVLFCAFGRWFTCVSGSSPWDRVREKKEISASAKLGVRSRG